ncbi:MAG: metallophosphoesterase family protein [Pseudomonadota bacterium]|nr:metallophosphoesterase family protein [Pseudomonadota bacterium]
MIGGSIDEQGPLREVRARLPGRKWIEPGLPETGESWLLGNRHSVARESSRQATRMEMLSRLIEQAPWVWPRHPICFICDPHADTDAFMASLVAAGVIRKTGPDDRDFKPTKAARKSRVLIGGDCFDKGPGVLRLLRAIRRVAGSGINLSLLAGNHDIRVLMGLRAIGTARNPRSEHFFARMGPKSIPLLKEIAESYLSGPKAMRGIPGTRECRRRLFPSKRWFDGFPMQAEWMMPAAGVEKEMRRMREKVVQLAEGCEAQGLSIRKVYAAALKCQEIFLDPKGEFSWFFRETRLAHREGTFLFIHAGIDDRIARVIADHGVEHLNRQFRHRAREDPFEFYYGPLANTIRTKYRPVDMPLTPWGVDLVNDKGIHAIVHGHRNLLHGQRIMLRKGMINFECDTSLDRNTRAKEGLSGHGASVTIVHPEGHVLGISNDYPGIKVFSPEVLLRGRKKSSKTRG